MKLETTIKPRRNGTVTAEIGKALYTFTEDADGRLVADVSDESHVGALLATGNFIPADESDFQAGMAAVQAVVGAVDVDADGDDDGSEEDDDESVNGLPLEANTPPSRRTRKVKKADE